MYTPLTSLEERKKQLTLTRERLIQEKKDHRARLETESREEAEFAKVLAFFFSFYMLPFSPLS